MKTFEYYFGISLGELVLRHSDNLSRTLQHKSLSAAEGQHVAVMVVKTIESMRSEEAYKLFWDEVIGVGTVGAPGARAPPTLPGIYIYGECKGS